MARPGHRPPLIGRERELAFLHQQLGHARQGEGKVALVAGEPGIGKTRLLREAAGQAHDAGWTVLTGRAYESEGLPPYLPFVEALRAYVRDGSPAQLRPQLAPGAAQLALLVPEIRERVPDLLPTPQASVTSDRYRLFEGICDVLDAIARSGETGLLLVLDDLHWADPPSLQLLQHLARRLSGTPIRILAAYRTVDVEPSTAFTDTLAALAREAASAVLGLAALSFDETAALVASITGAIVADPVAATIERATEGNPFFIREVVHQLQAEQRDLSRADAATDAWAVPERVRHVVAARLARLRPATTELLRQGAVLGDGFTFEVARVACGTDAETAITAVEDALAAGVLRVEGDTYHFAHALIRRTVYDVLSPARRQRLHLRAAETIESVHAGELAPHRAALAGHYRLAGPHADGGRVIEAALGAGEAAQAVLAWEDAAGHWRVALALMEAHNSEPARRAAVLERLGDLMYYTDADRRVGIAYLERALVLYEALGRQETVADIHTRIGRFMSSTPYIRNIPRILEHYRAAQAILSHGPEGLALCSLDVAMASTALSATRTDEGLSLSSRAMAMAKRLNDEALWADAARTHGIHLFHSGRLADGFAVLDQAWAVADRLDHAIIGFWTTMHHALTARRHLLDPLDAVGWCERELGKPRLAQAPHLRLQMTACLVDALILAGRVADTRAQRESPYPESNIAFAMAAGDWAEAERVSAGALDMARRAGDRNNTDWYASGLARVLRARGDVAQAESLLLEALAIGVEGPRLATELLSRADLALMCAELGRTTEAASHLARCHELVADGEDWRGLAGRISLAAAVVAAAAGQPAGADHQFGQAIATFRHYALPWDEAEARTYWTRVLLGMGQRAEALAQFEAAAAIYRCVGAGEPWHERLAALQDQPIPPGHVRPAYPDRLTSREVDVLRLLAEGKSNPEIAETLVISVNTVYRHVAHIFEKTGAANRVEAAAYAQRHSLSESA